MRVILKEGSPVVSFYNSRELSLSVDRRAVLGRFLINKATRGAKGTRFSYLTAATSPR